MFTTAEAITVSIIVCSLLLVFLIGMIIILVYRYQKRQHAYLQSIDELKGLHENALLKSQLEIQEQTFQNISREIHDNIGQKLTLAKLQLNTIQTEKLVLQKIESAVKMIGEAISDLSDLSRSMSSELVLQNGLIKALEFEASQLSKIGIYNIKLKVSCETMFLDERTELILFRIVQEAINNIIKHAGATTIEISLTYSEEKLLLNITDNGTGFQLLKHTSPGIGLQNMTKRAQMLGGKCSIISNEGQGTTIQLEIPTHEYREAI